MKISLILLLFFSLSVPPLLARTPVVLMQQLKLATTPAKKLELYNLISEHYREVDPKLTVLYGQKAATLALQLQDRKHLSTAYNNISIGHYWLNNLTKASSYTYQALEIRKELNDSMGMASSFNALGGIHQQQQNYPKALEFYGKSLAIGKRLQNKTAISTTLNNLGSTYEHLNQPEKALNFYLQVQELNRNGGDKDDQSLNDLNLGNAYFKLGQKRKALEHLQSALALSEEIRNEINKIYIYRSLALIHQQAGDYKKAAAMALKSLQVSQNVPSPQGVMEASLLLNEIYVAQKNYLLAHRFLQLHTAYTDTLQNKQKAEAQAEMHAKYELENIEAENDRLRTEQELQTEKFRQKELLQYSTGVLLLMALALVYVFAMGRKRAKRNNQQLSNYNQVILKMNEDIGQQKEELEKLNHQKDILFSIIAHDLRSPLISLQSLLQLLSMGSLPQEKLDRFVKELDTQQQNTLGLLDNLLLWAKIQMKGARLEPEPLSLQDMVQQNIDLLLPQAEKKGIKLRNSVSADHWAMVDSETLKLVFRNLLTNSIKFCQSGDVVEVSAAPLNEQQLVVTVKDTGVGISPENQLKLFGPNKLKEKGTANEKGNGLGLMLCKEFIEKNEGEIWVDSTQGVGSSFHFTVPLYDLEETEPAYTTSPQEKSFA